MSTPIPKRTLSLVLVLPISACQLVGSSESAEHDIASASRSSLGSMQNVSEIDGVWIGSLPQPADLDLARRRGISVAIDLSLPEEEPGYDLSGTCATHRIAYLHLGSRKNEIADESIDRVLAEVRRLDRGPVLIFCTDGSRAAVMFAIWRALDGGIGVEEAIVEARRSGMKPGASESFVRQQVARRARRADTGRNAKA